MAQPKREHEYPEGRPNRPKYWPDITLGNVLAILTVLLSAAGVWAATAERIRTVEVQSEEREKLVAQQVADIKLSIEKLETKSEKLDDKIDRVLTLLNDKRPSP